MAPRPKSRRRVERNQNTQGLTPNAVEIIASGNECNSQLRVRLSNLRPSERVGYLIATISDSARSWDVLLRREWQELPLEGSAVDIDIRFYVSSKCNVGNLGWVIICDWAPRQWVPSFDSLPKFKFPRLRRVQGTPFGSLLLRKIDFLTDEELSGDCESKEIADFLSQHQARLTLLQANAGAGSEGYMSTLKEFKASQEDRLKATLASNSDRETAERSALVFSNYREAYEDAIGRLGTGCTPAILKHWHSLILGNGLHGQAGQYRSSNVRAGPARFVPHALVDYEVLALIEALNQLEGRLLNPKHFVALAALAFFGILDIHPFADGNGRLARLVGNFFLMKAGFPFPVALFANPAQRKECTTVVEATRINFNMAFRGTDAPDDDAGLLSDVPYMGACVALFNDRLAKAITEFRHKVDERSATAAEEADLAAARRYREKQASGTCLICFEDKPNIATLCCGKAVHIACIATWLGSKNSCPQCRNELPQLPLQRGPQVNEEEDTSEEMESDDTTEEDDTTEDDTTSEVENEDTTSDADDTTDDTTVETNPHLCAYGSCRNKPALDCANDACGRCCVTWGYIPCPRHGT